jgi:hypothetical protein
MDHFKGISESERYNNDLLNEMRKQTVLLEHIAQMLQQQQVEPRQDENQGKRPYTRRKKYDHDR